MASRCQPALELGLTHVSYEVRIARVSITKRGEDMGQVMFYMRESKFRCHGLAVEIDYPATCWVHDEL